MKTFKELLEKTTELDEAGGFSYGAKPARKGSVAYNAMMKRKEQEKNQKLIEPKDQMVGAAKVVKEENQYMSKIEGGKGKGKGFGDKRTTVDDHLSAMNYHSGEYQKAMKEKRDSDARHHGMKYHKHKDQIERLGDVGNYRKESVELDETKSAADYEAIAKKHVADGQRGTRANMVYASKMAGRARRAAEILKKGGSQEDAFKHYQGNVSEENELDEVNVMNRTSPVKRGNYVHSNNSATPGKDSGTHNVVDAAGKVVASYKNKMDAIDHANKKDEYRVKSIYEELELDEAKVIGHVGDVAGHGKVVQCAKCDTDLRDDHGYALDNKTYVCRNGDKCSMRQSKNSLAAAAAKGQKPRWRTDESLDEAEDFHAEAMEHKKKSDAAMDKNDMEAYHHHMSAHHEAMGQWHESKGRSSSADKEYEKAEKHHELSLKKSNQKNEGTEMLSFKYFQQALVEAKKKCKESSGEIELAHGELLNKDDEEDDEDEEMYVKEGQAPVAPAPGMKDGKYAIMVHPESKQRVTIERKNKKNYPASEGWKEVGLGMKESVEELDEGDELNMRQKFVFNKTAAGKAREVARNREELKMQMKKTKEMGGITGPKGKLPEEVELDEISTATMSHQGKTTLKHVKNPGVQLRMAAHDIKPGIKGYRDRVALMKAADAEKKLKEEVETLDELSKDTLKSYSSKAWKDADDRAEHDYLLANTRGALRDLTTTRKTSKPSGSGQERPAAAERLKKADPELHKHLSGILDKMNADSKAEKSKMKKRWAGMERAKRKLGEEVELDEVSPFDWKAYAKEKGTAGSEKTKTFHNVKKTSTGTVYTKQVNPDGTSKGSGDDAAKAAEKAEAPKRGRGRPAGVGAKTGSYKPRDPAKKAASAAKAAASKAANRAARNEEFDNEFMGSLIEGFEDEDFNDFLQCEEFEELDEATQEALINFINEKSCGSYKMKESLTGKQYKLDKNKNGKIDSHDFKLLRKEETEQIQESVNTYAAFLTKKQ